MNKYEGHTKGPWSRNVPPASHYVTVWAGRNNHVGRIDTLGKSPEECEANLNLIADAPLLLAQRDRLAEALQAICARYRGEWDHPALVAVGALRVGTTEDMEEIARAALAALDPRS